MSTSETYTGQNTLISYIKNQKTKTSYCAFLKNYYDIIVILTISDNWDKLNNTWAVLDKENWNNLDNLWAGHFLSEGKDFPDIKDKLNIERACYARTLQIYWKRIIKEYKKENENHLKEIIKIPAKDQSIPAKNHSIFAKNYSISNKDYSISSNSTKDSIFTKDHSISAEVRILAKNHSKISYKNTNLINFCYNILQKLDEQSNIYPFYKYKKKIQIRL